MKRISLAGAAIAALFTIGVASSSAATGAKTTKAKVSCKSSLVLAVPAGASDVVQGATQGSEWGTTKCGKHFASGVMELSFNTDDSGNEAGPYHQYFNSGAVWGTYQLVANDNGGTFTSSSFAGTIVVKNGTGVYKGISGKGTLSCTSADSVHFACSEAVKVKLPAGA